MIQLSDNCLCLLSKDFEVMKSFMRYSGLDKLTIQHVTFGGFIKGEEDENK